MSENTLDITNNLLMSSDQPCDVLSHPALKDMFQSTVQEIIQDDPVLQDLHPQITVEEVEALLKLEFGQAMTVFIDKQDRGKWKLVVPRNINIQELKQALKQHVMLSLNRLHISKKISWQYIWKTYALTFNNTPLLDDNAKLEDIGIRNKSHLGFVKRLNERKSRKLTRRPKQKK